MRDYAASSNTHSVPHAMPAALTRHWLMAARTRRWPELYPCCPTCTIAMSCCRCLVEPDHVYHLQTASTQRTPGAADCHAPTHVHFPLFRPITQKREKVAKLGRASGRSWRPRLARRCQQRLHRTSSSIRPAGAAQPGRRARHHQIGASLAALTISKVASCSTSAASRSHWKTERASGAGSDGGGGRQSRCQC